MNQGRTKLSLDHLAVTGSTLEEAASYVEDVLGVRMEEGGHHDLFGTHNNLLSLGDRIYLECISIDPNAPKPNTQRWFDLDTFSGPPRLSNWVCSCHNIDNSIHNFNFQIGKIVEVTRGLLSWRITVPESGSLPFNSMFPAFIQWNSTKFHPSKTLRDVGCFLRRLIVNHPEADRLAALLSNLSDDVVKFEVRADPSLIAEIQTPFGRKELSIKT